MVTDNGNVILDVFGTEILDAIALENKINGIRRRHRRPVCQPRSDVALIGTADGVKPS